MAPDHHYDLVLTKDGTYTLHSTEFGESMHSVSGAYEEALLKHVYPSGILDSPATSKSVLDIGFGLGYNVLALLSEIDRKGPDASFDVVSFEKDRSLITLMDQIVFNDRRDDIYKLIRQAFAKGEAQWKSTDVKILFGDAREIIKGIGDAKFDAVFFDPFSPAKNPELWSVEFFREIHRAMGGSGILTTYSSAVQARAALIEAGFYIGKGPSVGGKREGTIAAKTGIIRPLSEADLKAIAIDPKAVPYRDPGLSNTRDNIRERRKGEIRDRKQERGRPLSRRVHFP